MAIGSPGQAGPSSDTDGAEVEEKLEEAAPRETRSMAMRTFESAETLDVFLEGAQRRGAVGADVWGASFGGAYGIGGLGLVGTGMGGGGTGSGYGKGAGVLGVLAAGEGRITNNQESEVDEGGIVKRRGDKLVILRRGRLFTASVADGELVPIDAIDVGPKRRHQAWYDEMLVHEDKVIVIGYSYALRATELATFEMDGQGRLRAKGRNYLRSNDYYSSRNYASRLVGDTLVFYMPSYLSKGWAEGKGGAPTTCHSEGAGCDDWHSVVKAEDIYVPVTRAGATLHAIVTCSLDGAMTCEGRGILGPSGRNFYVSADAVYVWVSDPGAGPVAPWREQPQGPPSDALLYRLGIHDSSVSALRTFGQPIDQFSFKESADGHLNVLIRGGGYGGGMWGAEANLSPDVALFRAPLSAFSTEVCDPLDAAHFTDLPDPEAAGVFHNRFVGERVIYGYGSGWGAARDQPGRVYVAEIDAPAPIPVGELELEHGVDRIEPMGERAVVIGARGTDLHFSTLDPERPGEVAANYVHPDAAQGELRSHGFFYRPLTPKAGLVGLPIRAGGSAGWRHLQRGSAGVLFLSAEESKYGELGLLGASTKRRNDRCHTSCTDWYGNARPIFVGERVFALLGYELVEGLIEGGEIVEQRRANLLDAL